MDHAEQETANSRADAHRAVVRGRITMLEATVANVGANSMKKGDVLGTARFAGVRAAKGVDGLIPMTSTVLVRDVVITFRLGRDEIEIEAAVAADDALGATMAAFSAAVSAGLTIYDMCKSADRTMVIGPVLLVQPPHGVSL